MENYRKMSHCTYDIKYHIVWITKYRKPVLKRPIAERTRELVRMVCAKNDVEILAGHVWNRSYPFAVICSTVSISYTSFQVLNKKSESSLKKQYNESDKQS